jgi:hypothetical protein
MKYRTGQPINRLLSVIIVLSLFCGLVFTNALANNFAVLTVGSDTVASGGVVSIPITLTNNPGGILLGEMEIAYDTDAMTLTSVVPGSIMTGIVGQYNNLEGSGLLFNDAMHGTHPNSMQFFSSDWATPISADGEFVVLTFLIDDNAGSGDYPIELSHNFANVLIQIDGFLATTEDWLNIPVIPTTAVAGTITVTSNGGDNTTPPGTTPPQTGAIDIVADYGGTITYDEATGSYAVAAMEDYYVIDKIVVDGVEIDGVQGLTEHTVLAANAPERSIVALFAYTVNFNTPANGALSVSRGSDILTSGKIVRGGEVLTIIAEPSGDYELDYFTFVGLTPTEEPNTYTVTAEQGDPTPSVSVSFKEKVIEEDPVDPDSPWLGGGTEQNPYRITSAAQLAALRDKVNEGVNYAGSYFLLTSSLDLTAGGAKWTPIGNSTEKPFSGVFDGGGNRLTVDIDDTTTAGSEQALFGWVGDAEIRNLAVYGSVKGYTRVAGIVGRVASGGTLVVENCENHANIMAANAYSAGIVAYAQGAKSVTIKKCMNYGNTSTVKSVTAGIITNAASNTTVTGCVNYGKISGADGATGSSAVGIATMGMSGYKLVISECANLGEVSGGSGASGIGSAAVIRNSYNAGPISGGYVVDGIGSADEIENCYNSGTVRGELSGTAAGGIVGQAGGNQRITGCYNSGAISSVTADRAGAIVGTKINSYTQQPVLNVTITNSYYLESSAAVGINPTSTETIPVTDAELRELASQLGSAFDVSDSGGYPILAWQLGDDSTAADKTETGGVVTAVIKGADLSAFTDGDDGGVYASFDLRGGVAASALNATVQSRTLAALSEANASLRLNTNFGNLTFDSAAITEIAAAAGTGDITLSASKLTADKTANTTAKALIAEGKPVYEFTLKAGAAPIFTGGTNKGAVSVVLPYTRQGAASAVLVKVYHIADGGAKTEVTGASYAAGDNNVSFTTNHFSLYSIEEAERPKTGGSGEPGSETQGRPDAPVWDGETIDVRWYTPGQSTYYINDAADLAGLAAIVNGIYNEDIIYIVGDDGKTKIKATWSEDGDPDGPKGNNMSTARYSVGTDDFNGKTVILNADINMGSANYMPIGGQYLMSKNDSTTKISSSFNGTFDGGGHSVTIYTDRHCSNGNYGDGSSVGLIGRLGVHDGEAGTNPGDPDLRAASPTVKNVAVYGSVRANRSVGGVVGKIGKTLNGAIVENCANFADVSNTDAKGCGGIVGAAWNGGVIRNCYNAGNISTTYVCPTGGIAGSNEITIENCYNVGKISATSVSFAMGIGTNNGSASYSTHVINRYYLADEGMAPGGGYYDGTVKNDAGRTKDYMKTDEFVALLADADGNNAYVKDTRSINSGYPILAWQGGTAVDPGTIPGTDDAKTTGKPETEAVTDVTVKDGEAVVTVKVPEKSAEATDTPERLVVNVDTKGETVSKITVEIPKEVIALESGSKSEIEIRSEVANVLLPEKAVAALAVTGEAVTVKAAKNDDASYTFTVAAGEKSIEKLDGGIKAVIPAEDVSPGTVAILVHADGTEEVIKKSVGKDGKVSIPLDGSATIKIVDNSKAFADVATDAWYSDGVKFTSSHELFQGTDDGGFAPEMSMTRGMLATVLHRLENAPTATGELFADVAGDAYYAEAIIWASANSIVNGTGDGFAPDTEINREQLAVMLYRYYVWTFAGDGGRPGTVAPTDANLSAFPDADGVSDWAEDAVIWAVGIGLINGRDSGLAPQGTATRAEVAVILERFIENIL